MKLAEFIPQVVDLFKNKYDISLAEETERRLKDLLKSEGNAELDAELAAIVLGQHKKIYDYNEISQKVYWAIYDVCRDFFSKKESLKRQQKLGGVK